MSCKEILTYVSDRDIPLLLGDRRVGYDAITLELHCKWYNPYIIRKDGTVIKLPHELLDLAEAKHKTELYLGHCFHPDYLRFAADYLTKQGTPTEVPELVIELAAGRWAIEMQDKFVDEYFLANQELPHVANKQWKVNNET